MLPGVTQKPKTNKKKRVRGEGDGGIGGGNVALVKGVVFFMIETQL